MPFPPTLAQRRRFEFVISFVHQDYDGMWDNIKASAPALFIAWRDCGLLDESGKPTRACARAASASFPVR